MIPAEERLEFLRGIPIFAGVSDAALLELAAEVNEVSFPAGSIIFREGAPGSEMFVIHSGIVEVIKHFGEEHETNLATLGARDFFGEMSIIECVARSATVRLGPLSMDTETDTVHLHGQLLALTRREAAALRVLLNAPGRTVSKEQLHTEVFADEATGLDAVEVLIYRLRKKLETAPGRPDAPPGVMISTFRGMGYMLTLPAGGR